MENKKLKILMIDDNLNVRDGYEIIAKRIRKTNDNITFDIVTKIDEALNRVLFSKNNPYSLICIDIEMPASYDGKITSGEDLAKKIKEVSPITKFLVNTYHGKKERLLHIYKQIQPEGFLLKAESGLDNLQATILNILDGDKIYSHTVERLIQKLDSEEEKCILDDIDRKILYYLNHHYTHQQIADLLKKSISTIDKRKRKLKENLLLDNDCSDAELLEKAKELGYINLYIN